MIAAGTFSSRYFCNRTQFPITEICNIVKGIRKWVLLMSMELIFEQAGLPLLVFVVCVYYGMRLIILQDVSVIRGKDKPPVRDTEKYAKEAGKLILFLGAAALGMAILIFFNVYVALAEFLVCLLIMGFLWKSVEEKYGA